MATSPSADVERYDEIGEELEGGPDSGGQAGSTQGLSPLADEAHESVEELAETGQAYEADVVSGVEKAAGSPGKPTPSLRERSEE